MSTRPSLSSAAGPAVAPGRSEATATPSGGSERSERGGLSTRALALIAVAAMAACGGGDDGDDGGGNGGTQAVTLDLAAQPATILLGQSATLTWASNGGSCTADGAWTGAQATNGSSTVTPTSTGTASYELTCSGGGYTGTVTRTAQVTVTAATLTELQASVFTPRCTGCHDGSLPADGSLPGSMNLTAGNTFASVVNVASRQQPAVLRVAPNGADASYLVRKVEGAAGINGQRMPLGGTPLDAAVIAQIRSWIAAGAANN